MKKLSLLLAVVIFASCSQVFEDKVNATADLNTISVDIPQTRTALGGRNEDGSYSVYWSAEDKLVANGSPSTSITIGKGGSSAQFTYGVINAPFKLTYPYTEGSLCSEGRSTVVYAAEQNYAEGSFGVGYAPMCGYNTGLGTSVLKHLAGVLRISLTGSTTLSKIEIIAAEGAALAGEFDVDCQTGDVTPIEGKTSNKVTYIANQKLSDEAKPFFIVVPVGNHGKCKVVLTDSKGLHMNLTWNGKDVKGGIVREFNPFAFQGGASFELVGMPAEEGEFDNLNTPDRNEIWYTATEEITPYRTDVFGAPIMSSTYENGKGVIEFNGVVASIGEEAFYGCTSLTSITLPEGVASIGTTAFQGCSNLTSFYGKAASEDNRCLIIDGVLISFAPAELAEYTIPESVTSIGDMAFGYCTSLTSVTIPVGITAIGENAFNSCESLIEVICKPTTPPMLGTSVFDNTNSALVIYVPVSSDSSIINAYKGAENWSSYKERIKEDTNSFGIDDMKGETEEGELDY